MMRALLLASASLLAVPAAAQDHSGHQMPANAPAMDHCAMGHLPPEQCPPKEEAAPASEPMDHSQMDHSQHGAMKEAGDTGAMDHSQHAMPMVDKSASGAAPEDAIPPRAFEGPQHAADAIWGAEAMAAARAENHRMHGAMPTGMIMLERLEARIPAEGGDEGFLWDAQAWYGGDLVRFVLKSEGEGEFSGEVEDAEVQALYSRAIGPFFDLQAGVRLDLKPETRSHFVIGVQGLAPYMFHVDAAAFLSDRGDLTARIEGEYDQKITQQLILQPRIELEASLQDIPEREIGGGLTKIESGLRLRYEIVPEFAPYIGVEYEAKLGETADIARANGEDPDGIKLLLGLRAWF
ncbi:copper resistance protein B [Altererythrobacter arenosus]|uniref:Copper resistance protein B n=1 Tax=Altererythrobacter arenosus TaxID=3032592 RepID=A0ABY8FVQ3_9SPHN|nr:copper resistance protein B [Altererythrobacter sp. CAU 1644]WFL76099.1 copper resistance protein B [Altererythrobacter sp. CAU 1644]